MPPPVATIGPAAARRAALAAQGFADLPPAGAVSRRHLARVLGRVQLLQLDSVNVAVRAHYVPVFSRLGPYEPALLDEAAWSHSAAPAAAAGRGRGRTRRASLRWRTGRSLLAAGQRGGGGSTTACSSTSIPAWSTTCSPRSRSSARSARASSRRRWRPARPPAAGASWWERSDVKRVCEFLFGTGALITGTRRHFQRLYDLPERVLPPDVLARTRLEHEAAARGLVLRAASALGVATEPDLRDYYRLGPPAHPGGARRAGRGRGAGAGGGARLGDTRRTGVRARASRGGSAGGRCSARSTR